MKKRSRRFLIVVIVLLLVMVAGAVYIEKQFRSVISQNPAAAASERMQDGVHNQNTAGGHLGDVIAHERRAG